MKESLLKCIKSDIKLVTSTVTIEEYLVYPFRLENDKLINNFLSFLENLRVEIIEINKEIAIHAAKLRSKYPTLRSMDALQVSICELKE